MNHYAIAIDGPSGAGKSTMAKMLAKQLGFIYVDTGALYRAIALFALRRGEVPKDEVAVAAFLPSVRVFFTHNADGGQQVFLNDEDVSLAIREHAVSKAASDLSAFPVVRAFLLDLQRSFALTHSVVMDGRDIGTVVLPDAEVKIFLTASAHDRARRRYEELLSRGGDVSFEQVLADVTERDFNDSNRAAAPLKQAADAVLMDTTDNTIEQSVQQLYSYIKEKIDL